MCAKTQIQGCSLQHAWLAEARGNLTLHQNGWAARGTVCSHWIRHFYVYRTRGVATCEEHPWCYYEESQRAQQYTWSVFLYVEMHTCACKCTDYLWINTWETENSACLWERKLGFDGLSWGSLDTQYLTELLKCRDWKCLCGDGLPLVPGSENIKIQLIVDIP